MSMNMNSAMGVPPASPMYAPIAAAPVVAQSPMGTPVAQSPYMAQAPSPYAPAPAMPGYPQAGAKPFNYVDPARTQAGAKPDVYTDMFKMMFEALMELKAGDNPKNSYPTPPLPPGYDPAKAGDKATDAYSKSSPYGSAKAGDKATDAYSKSSPYGEKANAPQPGMFKEMFKMMFELMGDKAKAGDKTSDTFPFPPPPPPPPRLLGADPAKAGDKANAPQPGMFKDLLKMFFETFMDLRTGGTDKANATSPTSTPKYSGSDKAAY
jgi:hypothetical protein